MSLCGLDVFVPTASKIRGYTQIFRGQRTQPLAKSGLKSCLSERIVRRVRRPSGAIIQNEFSKHRRTITPPTVGNETRNSPVQRK